MYQTTMIRITTAAALLVLLAFPLAGCHLESESAKEAVPRVQEPQSEQVEPNEEADRSGGDAPAAETAPDIERTLKALEATQEAFTHVAESVMPSVVSISVVTRLEKASGLRKGDDSRPRGDGGESEGIPSYKAPRRALSKGSGFIFTEDGKVATNAHVIRNARKIRVQLIGGKEVGAMVMGSDPLTDIAVLKLADLDEKTIPVQFGDSDRIKVGQWAVAIGNPFGFSGSVTVGVISAMGRRDIFDATPDLTSDIHYADFIQTDASINEGNSGGPLLDIKGNVIGMNTAIVESGQGVGFAIPINIVREILDKLVASGRVERGWLGIRIQNVDEALAERFGASPRQGVLINEVFASGPAFEGGLRRGDIICGFDRERIDGVRDLQWAVARASVDAEVELHVLRDGRERTLDVVVGRMPGIDRLKEHLLPPADWLGIRGRDIPFGTLEDLEIPGGLYVDSVLPDSFAERAGIRAGDFIQSLNREEIQDLENFRKRIAAVKKGDPVLLLVLRGRSSLLIGVNTK